MATLAPGRVIRLDAHDDGANAWSMARIAPLPGLAGHVTAYSDYREQTGGFTARREMPSPGGVMILNLGPEIEIVGGDGAAIRICPGEGFVGGAHLRHAVSRSSGVQAGIHVFLPMLSLRALLGVPMAMLTDRVVPLDAVLGREAAMLGDALLQASCLAERVALLDRALDARFAGLPAPCRQQRHAVALLATRPELDIAQIAGEIGWSRKHLAARGARCGGRRAAQLSPAAAVRARAGPAAWPAAQLGEVRGRGGLLRPIPSDPRISRICRHEPRHVRRPPAARRGRGDRAVASGSLRPIRGKRGSARSAAEGEAAMTVRPALIPCLRYRDAPAAIDFLCDAFGFERHAVYADPDDATIVHHAQLVLEGNMIMLSSALPGETQELYGWKTPAEAGGITMCVYAVVDDLDGHHAHASAAGAEIGRAPRDNEGYPGRGYDARDPEGNVWSFGSYDPFAD